jgi:hypothetical protein
MDKKLFNPEDVEKAMSSRRIHTFATKSNHYEI